MTLPEKIIAYPELYAVGAALIFYIYLWRSFSSKIIWSINLFTIKSFLKGNLKIIDMIKFILLSVFSWVFLIFLVLLFYSIDKNLSDHIVLTPLYVIFFGSLIGFIFKIYNLLSQK